MKRVLLCAAIFVAATAHALDARATLTRFLSAVEKGKMDQMRSVSVFLSMFDITKWEVLTCGESEQVGRVLADSFFVRLHRADSLKQAAHEIEQDNAAFFERMRHYDLLPSLRRLRITEVKSGSRAEKLGVKPGDALISYGAEEIHTEDDFARAWANLDGWIKQQQAFGGRLPSGLDLRKERTGYTTGAVLLREDAQIRLRVPVQETLGVSWTSKDSLELRHDSLRAEFLQLEEASRQSHSLAADFLSPSSDFVRRFGLRGETVSEMMASSASVEAAKTLLKESAGLDIGSFPALEGFHRPVPAGSYFVAHRVVASAKLASKLRKPQGALYEAIYALDLGRCDVRGAAGTKEGKWLVTSIHERK